MESVLFLRIKAGFAAALSAVIFTFIAVGFGGETRHLMEMTFISNTFAASVLLYAALYIVVKKRDIPFFLYLDATTILIVVFFVCLTFAPGVAFSGSSIGLHLISPALSLTFYLLFCDARNANKRTILTALVIPNVYYAFMIAYGRVTGASVYIYFDPNNFGAAALVFIGILAGAFIAGLCIFLMHVSIIISRIRAKKSAVGVENQRP